MVVGIWSIASSGRDAPPERQATVGTEPNKPNKPDPTPDETGVESADVLPAGWVPRASRFILHARPNDPPALDSIKQATAVLGAEWPAVLDRMLSGLGMSPRAVDELTWASTDLDDWYRGSLIVLRLAEGHSAKPLQSAGKPLKLRVQGAVCRQLESERWPLPFAVLDQRTVATGQKELLERLGAKSTPSNWKTPQVGILWKALPAGASMRVVFDIGAARVAGWPLPQHALDVWPSGAESWRVLWQIPRAMGMSLEAGSELRGQLGFACEGATPAKQVQAALDTLIPEARSGLESTALDLQTKLKAGRLTVEQAEAYGAALKQALVGLRAARWEVADATVWCMTEWPGPLSEVDEFVAESRSAARADWQAAAETADREQQERILSGLSAYDRAQGHLPEGAAGGKLMPPETRLGWLAEMLPYFDHTEWHRQLQFSYPWNGPQNRKITRQPLGAAINPGLGPSRTEAGFPVTHYVGVSGVGEDAGMLPPDDPRAGLFGYGRTTSPAKIPDGASNTIAILGVSDALGPWAAGGRSSVRSLTKRPYVNGPDGFGSGRPDGMLAGMADGSVRFISKEVDPRVLEQLATAAGGESASIDQLAANRPASAEARDGKMSEPDPESSAGSGAGEAETADAGASSGPEAETDEQAPSTGAPAPSIDAAQLLAVEIPAFEIADKPLREFVRTIELLAGVAVSFDLDALERLGVELDDRISLRTREASIGQILRAGLAERGLDLVVGGSFVLATAPAEQRSNYRDVRYSVGDLADEIPEDVAELARRIVRLVAPDSWDETGGRGTIDVQGSVLVVHQTPPVHYDTLVFCEKLRKARGKSLRSRLDASRFELAPRTTQAAEMLDIPLTVNFHQPTPLSKIANTLSDLVEGDLVVNWAALQREGLGPQTKGSVAVEDVPLAKALEQLLKPLGLGYRAVDSGLVEITTAGDLNAELELEFYPVGSLLTEGQDGSVLVEKIKSQLAGATWSDAGGPGVILFDRPSRCLLVVQSQPVHRRLEALLEGLSEEAGK